MSAAEKTKALDALTAKVDLAIASNTKPKLSEHELRLISESLFAALDAACAQEWKERQSGWV